MAPQVDPISKIALLKVIQAKKTILFGKFSKDLDNREKHAAWQEVLLKAKSLGIVTADRDVTFIRDKVYGVWKSRALEKRDNKNQTGKGGGRELVMNEVDKLIIEIIGKDTVTVDGIPVGESGVPTYSADVEELIRAEEEEENLRGTVSRPHLEASTSSKNKASNLLGKRLAKSQPNILDDKKRKDAHILLMEVKTYKTKLECLKLERDLDIPPSNITKYLFDSEFIDSD